MKKAELNNIQILLVDNDIYIARIVIQHLQAMGFSNLRHVRKAEEALNYISTHRVDILITEWTLSPMDGLELVKRLRLSRNSPNRDLPIIMLTGRGELIDVAAARDVGITEFLVKPFTVKTLYDRIEHLIEHPRPFLLSQAYVGPDRRRRKKDSIAQTNRRHQRVKAVEQLNNKEIPETILTPLLVSPSYALKSAIGLSTPLSAIITLAILETAQQAIDNLTDDGLQWIKEDLSKLEDGYQQLQTKGVEAQNQIKETALLIKSRAGIFGFSLCSAIARLLYLFISYDFSPQNTRHRQIVKQSIESIKVLFAKNIKGRNGLGEELLGELEQLIKTQSKS